MDDLMKRILDIEVRMFLTVPTDAEPACRSEIDAMRLHRRSQFAGWSDRTLRSYLSDLEAAEAAGRNLLTLKYARMDDRIPPLSTSPDLSPIVEQMTEWQAVIHRDYPHVMRGGRDLDGFRRYLSAELETYSDATLQSLHQDLEEHRAAGGNMARMVYETMAELAGFSSLEEMERRFG